MWNSKALRSIVPLLLTLNLVSAQSDVSPSEVYYGDHNITDAPTLLRIGNGGAGQSGLVKALANAFINDRVAKGSSPFAVAWYRSDTAVTINYLSAGTVDVGITYNSAAETIAINQGIAKDPSYYAFRDHFYVTGPKENPANISTSGDIDAKTLFAELFAAATEGRTSDGVPVRFLSRYDKSATNIKESEMWIAVGQVPWATAYSTWYHQYIAFPIQALTASILLKEYTLTDRGTFLSLPSNLTSEVVIYKAATDEQDDPLLNPAHLLVGTKAENPDVADEFAEWLVGEAGQGVISGFEKEGEQLYSPAPTKKQRYRRYRRSMV